MNNFEAFISPGFRERETEKINQKKKKEKEMTMKGLAKTART